MEGNERHFGLGEAFVDTSWMGEIKELILRLGLCLDVLKPRMRGTVWWRIESDGVLCK